MIESAITPGLTFDPEPHVYRLGGAVIPGLTDLLRPLVNFDYVPPATLEAARERGGVLHKCIELDHDGGLDEGTVDPVVRPYFDAWRAFRSDIGPFVVLGIETPIASRTYRYGCTPDLWGRLDGRPCVIEIKTTAADHPTHAVQTAGQAQALIENMTSALALCNGSGLKWHQIDRYSLRLMKTGRYRFTEHTDVGDLGVLLALRQVAAFRQRHNL